jgi:hypothetical protein
MEPVNGKALRTAATMRRARNVASGKSTRPYSAKQLTDKSAEARAWLARRHRAHPLRRS